MAKNRIVQHRTTEKSKTKEIAELKKENHNLRRRVAKLQKYLQKALETSNATVPDPETPIAETLGPDTSKCPQCGGHKLVQIPLPSGNTLRGCKTCDWKKKE